MGKKGFFSNVKNRWMAFGGLVIVAGAVSCFALFGGGNEGAKADEPLDYATILDTEYKIESQNTDDDAVELMISSDSITKDDIINLTNKIVSVEEKDVELYVFDKEHATGEKPSEFHVEGLKFKATANSNETDVYTYNEIADLEKTYAIDKELTVKDIEQKDNTLKATISVNKDVDNDSLVQQLKGYSEMLITANEDKGISITEFTVTKGSETYQFSTKHGNILVAVNKTLYKTAEEA